jgi:UDP-glucose:(heptosyl)LPS alpha-1,3-glucosyltransferase
MRIAIIKSNFTPYGGAEKYTLKLIDAFIKNNVAVDVITSTHSDWSSTSLNFRQIVLNQFRYNNLLRLLTFNASVKQYLKKEPYDCILGMECTGYETHLRAGGGCHSAWIQRRCVESSWLKCLSFKINPFHKAMIAMEKHAFLSNKLKRIICNSHLVEREMAYFYPQVKDKLTVVHNGVEWNEFSEVFETGLNKRNDILQNLHLNPDRFFFLFVGSGYERKGLAKAIMALPLLPEHTELIVAGKDKQQNRYQALCKNLGLAERVHFFGPQENIIPFLQVSDAFVLPTIYDPFSNASLEALAMGLYTITSDANGCAEVINDRAGFIIRNLKDIDSVAAAMKKALGNHLSKKEIRNSIRYLDFEAQLKKIVHVCLSDAGYNKENEID